MSENTIASLTEKATALMNEGKTAQARDELRKALALSEQELGLDHPDTLALVSDLSVYCGALGDYEEALTFALRAADGRAAVLGDTHPDTLSARHNAAHALFCLGRADEAVVLAEQVLAHRPAGDPLALQAMMNLAACYGSAGRVEEALATYDKALALQIKLQGERHPETLTLMRNLINMYRNVGRLDDSVRMAKRLLVLCDEQFGNTAAVTVEAMQNLAACYAAQSKHEKAIKLLDQALECQHQTLGEGHPETAVTKNSLAVNYVASGQPQKAYALFTEVLEQQTALFGEDHPAVADALQNLAFCCVENNRGEEALRFYRRLLDVKTKLFGAESETALHTMQDLAMQYIMCGQTAKGYALAEEALALTEKVYGTGSAEALAAAEMLADCYRSERKDDEAATVLKRALAATEGKAQGPETVHTVLKLAAVYYDTQNFGEAWRLSEQAAEVALAVLGEDHPGTLNTMNILYSSCVQLEKYERAREVAARCLTLRENALGTTHPDTIATMQHLADIENELDNPVHAVELAQDVIARMRKSGLKKDEEYERVWHNLAYYAFCAERYDAVIEAGRAMYTIAAKRSERAFPVAVALQIIADGQNGCGQYGEARRNAEKAVAIARDTAPNDGAISQFYCTLADACFGEGDTAAARTAADECVRLCEAAFGAEDEATKDARRFAEKFR